MSEEGIIRIPRVQGCTSILGNFYDINSLLMDAFNKCGEDMPDEIRNAIKDASEICIAKTRDIYKQDDELLDKWEQVLFGYYKMTAIPVDDRMTRKVYYIHPYLINRTNMMLFTLSVANNETGEYYAGGVRDTSLDISKLSEYDIELKPITAEEFRDASVKGVDETITIREKKIEARRN